MGDFSKINNTLCLYSTLIDFRLTLKYKNTTPACLMIFIGKKNGIIWLRFPILQTHKNVLVYVRFELLG